MAKTTSIQLNDHWQKFIAERIEAGRFDSVSEAMRGALRLLEEHENGLFRIDAALLEGEESGDAGPLDIDEIIGEAKAMTRNAA
jgi:antitoxin ParD1/3/4